MNIRQATTQYERWLASQMRLLPADLRLKHEWMREDPFPFLRATFYRWAQVWPEAAAPWATGPKVLSVGDLHIENFGTWRDAEGRLVWGVNDFDEAYPLPYTNDLIRLATSAFLAVDQIDLSPKRAAAEILRGYEAALRDGGGPFVLVDRATPLRVMVRHRLKEPQKFWKKLKRFAPCHGPLPKGSRQAIDTILPKPPIRLRFSHRIAGLGSLGRERFMGLGTWQGGNIAREAKPLALSACVFAGGSHCNRTYLEVAVRGAVRTQDPYWKPVGAWIARRLSPDCFRLELDHLPKDRDEMHLLYSMGWETANIHLGSGKAAEIRRDLGRKPARWLFQAAAAMEKQVLLDWRDWRK